VVEYYATCAPERLFLPDTRTWGEQTSPELIHPSAWKVNAPKLISVDSPLQPQRPLPGLLMDTPPFFPDEFFGLLRRK
jgi:hypothetical protein